jgi:hypothetical protein
MYAKARANAGLFFILFDVYDESPLRMFRIESGNYNGRYAVMQRTGGPTIDFLASVEYRKDDCEQISDGMIGYHPTYRSTITHEIEEVSKELIKLYRHIAKELKRDHKTIKGHGGRVYLIGPHTYQRIKNGTLRLGVEGLKFDE